MDSREVMNRVGAIIEAHGTGLLATIGRDGHPHVRWMTPTLLRESPGRLYALTAPGSPWWPRSACTRGWSGCSRRRRWTR